MSLMVNTEECTYVRAVSESPTALDAVARWSPTTTPPKKVKRLNNQPKQTGSRGKGGFRGKKRGRGGSRGGYGDRGRGGHRGGRGGRGGYKGSSRGPTIVQSGIHYHMW